MSRRSAKAQAELLRRARAQSEWYESHGGSLSGYIERYGDPGVTETWFGEGGTRIHEADYAALVRDQKAAGIIK